MSHASRIADVIVRRARLHGPAGEAWLADLDHAIADLARAWGLELGEVLHGGTEAAVIEARMHDDREAVLKLLVPGQDPTLREARVLLTGGPSYPEVYAHDAARGAILMERLGAQLVSLGLPVDDQIEVICRTLRGAWSEPPAEHDFISGAQKAIDLAAYIEERQEALGRPCPAAAVDLALRYCQSRQDAYDPSKAVLGHGDAHPWNTLQVPSDPSRFKMVDPDGLVIEPAYDLGISMREWGNELLASGDPALAAQARCELLARLTNIDPRAIWEWGFIERVSTGMAAVTLAWPGAEREFFDTAAALAARPWTWT